MTKKPAKVFADGLHLATVDADWWDVIVELAHDVSPGDLYAFYCLEHDIYRSWTGQEGLPKQLARAAMQESAEKDRPGNLRLLDH